GGSDTIEVCADYMDAVEEGNEENNCRDRTLVCKDIVITDIWTDNSTIYYKIKNAGDEKVGASNTSLTIDGVFTTSHYVGPLEPEEERTESIMYTWTCTGGSDTIEVCADYMDAVEEGNEENNCRNVTWTCPPDISVRPASFDVRLPPGVVKSYTLIIWNIGGGTLEFSMGGTDSQLGWPIETGGGETGGGVRSSPALGDIDGDGDIEVVVGSGYSWDRDGMVYAWHHNGFIVAGWPKTTGAGVESSPALGDIDGDGDIEVVVGSCDVEVYAWHHNGSTVTEWPKTTSGGVRSSPALGDIDGDGDIEVVVGSADHKVHVWDCSGIYNPNNIEWGTFHHDVRNTGLYETKPPRKAGWLSGYVTNGILYSDNQKNITITFNTSGLEFGDYHVNITIASDDLNENIVIIPVRLTVAPLSQKGDINHDNQITPADATIALQLAASGAYDPAADVSGDDRVTSLDALMILHVAAGAISL
ncbi:MAG: CARDB domain-containing protein, partial [Euryarchaeota archaeon]|nr:CARDB domain-containing protein [Euryarchaeota archaeon]